VTAIVAGGEEVFLLGSREIAAGSELDVYSEASPLGAAILGLAEGEKTSYTAPNGREIPVEIVKVETYTRRSVARSAARAGRTPGAPRPGGRRPVSVWTVSRSEGAEGVSLRRLGWSGILQHGDDVCAVLFAARLDAQLQDHLLICSPARARVALDDVRAAGDDSSDTRAS
jgi:hypothetical protein